MNPILEDKIRKLERANDYECWYLVKQPADFCNLCYLVSFLKAYKSEATTGNLSLFISEKISELNDRKPDIKISDNYRTLRVAIFFGLIQMTSAKYETAVITDTFEEINTRCNGEFERTDLYQDVIQRQIEKMYISSNADEERDGVRRNFRLYPVMLLYKVLLEMGHSTGKYFITMTEYRYLVATTEVFEDFLETLLLIKLLREDMSAHYEFERYRDKFDSRLIQALKQLPSLEIDRVGISISPDYVSEVARKVYAFEQNPGIFSTDDYEEFLGSKKSLFDLGEPEAERNSASLKYETGYQSDFPRNRIIFGAPGTGKSYTLNREKEELLSDGGYYERVTFHPNYSYANFVGTYKPVMGTDKDGNETIKYEYVPGPFLRVYVKALENSKNKNDRKPFLLLIEEINRANVAAVFGDVFQLLDRNGSYVSEYAIQAAEDMKKYLSKKLKCEEDEVREIKIPDNMFIWATMNSADQGVFPVDTAFKRRWDFGYIGVDEEASEVEQYIIPVGMSSNRKYVRWNELRVRINAILSSDDCRVNEDKLLGPFFVSKNMLEHALTDEDRFVKAFESKVIMYLFEDVMKMRPANIFKGHKGKMIFSEICRTFEEYGEELFGITDLPYLEKPEQE